MDITISLQENQGSLSSCTFILELLSYLATLATVCISGYAVWYARKEYSLHKKEERANTLARYNERYSTNERLLSVVEYLWQIKAKEEFYKKRDLTKGYKDIKEELEQEVNSRKKCYYKIPSEHDKELFLRFFEEIQCSIEQGALDKSHVKELFYFYAKVAHDMGEDFVEDYNKDCWRKFKVFIRTMN